MPLIFTAIWSAISSGFGALVTFCSKPPGTYIAIAAAVAIALWWYGQHEFNAGAAKCEAAHKAASAKETTRQVIVGKVATAASEARTTPAATQDKSNRAKVIYVHDKAAALPPPPAICPAAVPSDLADGLRALN